FDVSGGGESGEIVLNFSDGLDVTGSATASLDGADAAGGVAWFFFEIVTEPVVIIPVANDLGILGDDTSVLTLDTFGSVLGDTEMGLYDAAGNLLDENDDAGAETFQSELVAQNLAEGTYYVAVSAYNTTFGVSGFDVFGGGESGEIVLNFSDGLDVAGSVTASLDGTDDTGGVAWFSFEIAAEPPTTTVLGGGLEVEVVDSELGRELVVSFAAQEDGLIFELETSEDLQNWSPAPGAVFSQNDNGTQAALPIPDGAGFFGRLFVRLRVTRP
ncbi:MAG: DUF3999 domain-containing protein, partial [Roseibacillus sp.]|nr:DUF3999 domain-containing protein [Roseibacillus sp.]